MLERLTRDPWVVMDDLLGLQGEFNRLLAGSPSASRRAYAPAINVWVSEHDVVVDAELPGANKDELEVSVRGHELTLRARRDAEAEGTPARRERSTGDIARTIALPYRVQADKVNAKYANGILRVALPRAEDDKRRQIAVEAA